MNIMRKRPITPNYEKSGLMTNMKMDRRLLLMQNIKVRWLWMKKIYDRLLCGRKLQMLPEDKDSVIGIVMNFTLR